MWSSVFKLLLSSCCDCLSTAASDSTGKARKCRNRFPHRPNRALRCHSQGLHHPNWAPPSPELKYRRVWFTAPAVHAPVCAYILAEKHDWLPASATVFLHGWKQIYGWMQASTDALVLSIAGQTGLVDAAAEWGAHVSLTCWTDCIRLYRQPNILVFLFVSAHATSPNTFFLRITRLA